MTNVSKINFANFNLNQIQKSNKTNTQTLNRQTKKPISKTKAIVGTGILVAAVSAAYLLRKNQPARNFVRNFFNKNNQNAQSQAPSLIRDNLGYEIMPPAVNPLTRVTDSYGFHDPKYNEILDNINKDPNTLKRFREVKDGIISAFDAIGERVQEATGINIGSMDKRACDRLIAQKRYFSIQGNHSTGYCCLDPLLYKEARQEALDIYFGYNILEELNTNSESRLLNALREHFGSSISVENNKFLNNCVERIAPEGRYCHGKNSVVHAFELSHVGKIFREAMGISVQ